MTRTPRRDLDAWACLAIIGAAVAALLALSGCWQAREQRHDRTERSNRLTLTGTLALPAADGSTTPVPVDLVLDHTGSEQTTSEADRRGGIDGQALGRELGSAVRTALAGAGTGTGLPWAQLLSALGATSTTLGVGYLAMKKRQQLKEATRAS